MPQGWEIEGETPKPEKAKKAVDAGWEVEPEPSHEVPKSPYRPRLTVGSVPINPSANPYVNAQKPWEPTPSFWNEPEDKRPWLVRKPIGVAKALAGGVAHVAKGLGEFTANPPKWAQLAMATTNPTMIPRLAGIELPGEKAYRESWQQQAEPAITGFIEKYGTPTEREKSIGSNIAGMIPLVAEAAIPGAGVPLVSATLAGMAQGDVADINKQRALEGKEPIPGYQKEGYTLLNAALGALKPGAPAKTFLGAAAKTAGTFGALNLAPAVYRGSVFKTDEDYRKAITEGLETGSVFGLLHHAATQPRTTRSPRFAVEAPKLTAGELEAQLPLLLEGKAEGLSPQEIFRGKAGHVEAREMLERLAADPEHPLERVVDKKGRVRYKLPKEVPDAVQVERAAQEVPRDGEAGRDLAEGGEGVRSGLQGEEIARTGEVQAQEGQVAPVVPTPKETTLESGVPSETLPPISEANPSGTLAGAEGGAPVRPLGESGAERGAATEVQPGMGEVPPVAAGGREAVGPEKAQGARNLIDWLHSEEGLVTQEQAPQIYASADPVKFQPREGEPIEFNRDISGRTIIVDEASPTSKTVGQISMEVDPNGDLYVKYAHNGDKPGAGTFLYQEAIKLAKEHFPEVTDQSQVYGDVTPDAVAFREKVGGTSFHAEGDSTVAATPAGNFLKRGAKPEIAPVPTMTLKVKGGSRTIELTHPEDQARFQEAVKANDNRVNAIKEDPALQGEENAAARAKAYQDSGKQLRAEKIAIEQAIQQREANLKASEAPDQTTLAARAKKAAADGEGGTAQSDSVILANRQREARDLSRDLMDHGMFNFAEWSRNMKEHFGRDTFDQKWLQKIYTESLGLKMTDPRVIRAELAKPSTFQEGLEKAAAFIAPNYKGNGEIPARSKTTLFDEPPPMLNRDYGASEVKGLSKVAPPRNLLTGVINFWKGKVFDMGQDPITDSLIAETAASKGTHADQAWAADVFNGLDSARETVNKLNGPLAEKMLDLKAQEAPYLAEAAEAAGSKEAKALFEQSQRGQEYKAIQEQLQQVYAAVTKNSAEMAKSNPDVRIFLHASEAPGSEAQMKLEGLMGPAEVAMSNKLREYFQERKLNMEDVGLTTMADPYVHWSGIRDMAPEAFDRLRDAMSKHRGREGEVVPLQDVLNFLHRDGNVPFNPSATSSLASYIPSVNRRLALQPFLNRWNAAIDSNFNGKAPRAAKYINEMIQSGMEPGKHSEALSLIRNMTFLKTLWGNLGTAVKHGFKVPLTYADHGPMNFVRALSGAGDAVLPEGFTEHPSVKKALKQVSKLTGGLEEGEREVALRLSQAMGATKEMNAAIADIPWLQDTHQNRTVLQKLNKYAREANNVGTTPVRLVEQMELGINVLASLMRARDAGIGGDNAIRGAIHSTLANNFRGLWDTSPFLRTTQGQVLGMFTGTPTKILGRYAEYALLPEAVDIYGTKNGTKMVRSLLILGALKAAGEELDSDLFGKAIHTPFITHDEMTGATELSLGPLAAGAEDIKFTPQGMKKFALKQIPYTFTKAARTYTGMMPKTYNDSAFRYWTGVPKQSIKEAQQKGTAAKEEAKERKSIERNELIKALRKAGLM